MNKHKFFIGIGPSKTGSTWLYRILQQHSEVQMPPIKEINYFSIEQNIGKTNIIDNVISKYYFIKLKRKWSLQVFKSAIQRIDLKSLYWVFIYFCIPSSDTQYKKLFSKNKVSGDVSPNYSNLSESYIQRIKKLNPKAKIIIGIRDPIDRIWSHNKMVLLINKGKKSISEISRKNVFKAFKQSNTYKDRDYSELITKWSKYFPEEQIFIYYFEELQENPQRLLNRICEFLEIQPIEIENIKEKVHKGIVEKIPAEYEKKLIELNYKYIEKFAEKHPNKYSLAWLKKYKKDI